MAGIGQLLRETREAKGLTLDDVEQEIRIRSSYLEALENEDYDRLPGAVYVRGFLRNYARFLGVELEETPSDNSHAPATADLSRAANNHRMKMNEPMAVPLEQSPSRLVQWLVIALIVVAALGGGGYWAYHTYIASGQIPLQLPAFLRPTSTATATATSYVHANYRRRANRDAHYGAQHHGDKTRQDPPHRARPRPSSTDTLTPAPTDTATITPTPVPTDTPTITPTPTAKVYQGVEVSIVLRERSWLQVTVDGVRVHEGVLEAGDTRKWEGTRSVALRAGNAGGVVVKLNGELLGPLGETDEVVDIEWTYDGPVEIENPTARRRGSHRSGRTIHSRGQHWQNGDAAGA